MTGLSLRMFPSDVLGKSFSFLFEGDEVTAYPGETVAAALWAAGIRKLRNSPTARTPRGAFCMMGSCQECVVLAEGVSVEACRLEAVPGLTVTQIRYDHA